MGLALAALVTAAYPPVHAEPMPLVDFQAAAAALPETQESPRPWTLRSPTRILSPLDLDQPAFHTGTPPTRPAFFTAAEAWTSADAPILDTGNLYLKLHDNEPPGWPDEPCVMLALSETTGGQQMFHAAWVNLWTKPLFQGMADPHSRIRLGPDARLAVTYTAWSPDFRPGSIAPQIRFLIRNAGTTYISEFAYRDIIDRERRIVLDHPAATRWAPVAWSAESFRIPDALDFQNVAFEDVEAVGFIQQNSGSHLRLSRWNRFEFHTDPASGPTSYAFRSSRPPHVRNAGMAWVMRAGGHVPSSVAGRPASLSLD